MLEAFPDLVVTKLHRPPVSPSVIVRPRLYDHLNLSATCLLTLVCAPAGFGKTTLISAWLKQRTAQVSEDMPAAWLSLDVADNDLFTFLRYFTAAVRTVYPESCERLLELLRAPSVPPPEWVTSAFQNDLHALPGRLLLVMDDYHVITSEAIHGLVGVWCSFGHSNLHLMLTARDQPPLQLSRLRAQGMVSEIRSHDLRFTLDESGAFMSRALPAPLSAPALARLQKRAEGWPAGMQLAALALVSAPEPQTEIEDLTGGDPFIANYLIDEVVNRQPADYQEFLLLAALPERFCADLAGALAAEAGRSLDVRATLKAVEQANLFLSPVDAARQWFRFHPLFRETLANRLAEVFPAPTVLALHCRAARWFAEHGFVDEGLRHALAAGDLVLAAELMEAGFRDVLNQDDRPTLERWLNLLPESLIAHRPALLLIKLWALQVSWRPLAQLETLRNLEALLASAPAERQLADASPEIRGQMDVLIGQAAYFAGNLDEALARCRSALSLLPAEWTYVRGGAAIYLALAMQATGQGRAVEQWLSAQFEAQTDKLTGFALRLLVALCFVYYLDGRLHELNQTAGNLLDHAEKAHLAILRGWGRYFLGLAAFLQNNLETARQHFSAVLDIRHTTQVLAVRASFSGLAVTQAAQGKPDDARRTAEQLSQFDLDSRGAEADSTRSLRLRVGLAASPADSAPHGLNGGEGDSASALWPLLWLEEPPLTRARILIRSASPADLDAAIDLLSRAHEAVALRSFVPAQVECLVLRACALAARSEPARALADVRQALGLAEAGLISRPFFDGGRVIQALLSELAARDGSSALSEQLLAGFQERKTSERTPQPDTGTAALPEPLTRRELDILLLLQDRLSDKEIALRLGIATATVKRHSANLYVKLEAHRRGDAVERAQIMGILPRN